MTLTLIALLTGFAWMGLRGDPSPTGFMTGMVLGAVVWKIEGARSRGHASLRRAPRLFILSLRVLVIFVWELLIANWDQLRVVLAPRIDVQPHWIHFDTTLESPALRILLGVMISLTPGTLVCDEFERADGEVCLWIHILDSDDPDAVVARICKRLQAPLRALEAE